jgi:hypothetical protein
MDSRVIANDVIANALAITNDLAILASDLDTTIAFRRNTSKLGLKSSFEYAAISPIYESYGAAYGRICWPTTIWGLRNTKV